MTQSLPCDISKVKILLASIFSRSTVNIIMITLHIRFSYDKNWIYLTYIYAASLWKITIIFLKQWQSNDLHASIITGMCFCKPLNHWGWITCPASDIPFKTHEFNRSQLLRMFDHALVIIRHAIDYAALSSFLSSFPTAYIIPMVKTTWMLQPIQSRHFNRQFSL